MNKSESIKDLAAALAKFQEEVKNPANSAKNPQYGSKYAPLSDVLAIARPILGKNGLSIINNTGGDLENVEISTTLMHSSGEWIQTDTFKLKGEQAIKGGGTRLSIHGAGSVITYARRYQIAALLGLASGEDDDGNHAAKETVETPEEKAAREAEKEAERLRQQKITAPKAQVIRNLITEAHYTEEKLCAFYEVDSIEDITNEMFARVTKSLKTMVNKYLGTHGVGAEIEDHTESEEHKESEEQLKL